MPVNPANFGSNAIGAVEENISYDTDLLAFTTAAKLIELRPPLTLQPVREFYRADRMKGNPSPDPMVPGMQLGQGLINLFLDPKTIAFWLKHLLMADTSTIVNQDLDSDTSGRTTPFDTALRAAATYTSGTAIILADDAQPAARIEAHQDRPTDPLSTFQADTYRAIPYPSGLRSAQIVLEFESGVSTGGRTIRIIGTDQNDTDTSETITRDDITAAITGGDAEFVMSSINRYKTITSLTVTNTGTSPDSGELTINAKLALYYHRLGFTKEVNEGLTIEIHEGNRDTPTTYRGAFVRRGILQLEDVSRFVVDIVAARAEPRKDISKGTDGTDLSTLTRPKPDFIPNWGMSFEILDTPGVPNDLIGQHRIANANYIIDNLIAPPATSFAEDTTYPKCVRKGNRDLMFATVVDHHKDLNFDGFVGGGSFEAVVSAVSRPYAGPYQGTRLVAKNTQLISFPARPITDLAEVVQNVTTRMNIGDAPDGNDEAYLEIYNTDATVS